MLINKEPTTLISDWFGEEFNLLHPTLRALHTQGGTLEGKVSVKLGKKGIAKYLGEKLAKQIRFPSKAGEQSLSIKVYHTKNTMNWDRTFGQKDFISNIIKPVGIKENGFFLEESGPFKWRLSVDIINGAWHWRWLEIRAGKKKLSNNIFPNSHAIEYINDKGQYVFSITFNCIGIGEILPYRGILNKTE